MCPKWDIRRGALSDFPSAAQIEPNALAEFWLGRVFEDKGRLQEAASAYQAALQLAPASRRLSSDSMRFALKHAGSSHHLSPGVRIAAQNELECDF